MIESVLVDPVIKGILDYPSESRAVELKSSMPWSDISQQQQLQETVKSILGMSNIKDGGKIIIGIRQNSDKTFEVTGVCGEDLETYDPDKIYQAVRNYGEPAPRFEVKNMEYKGKFFVVFLVQEFLYSPVICCKNGKNIVSEPLVKGALYIRTHSPGTKKVDNETEMREIINLAIDKEIESYSARTQKICRATPHAEIPKGEIDDKKFTDEIRDVL